MPLGPRRILTLVLAAAWLWPAEPQGSRQPGEATIWYLGHCGYAVRTKSRLLVFDYSKAYGLRPTDPRRVSPPGASLDKGWIDPEEIKDLDVVVFVSHNHGDHHDQVIRTWEKTVRNIHYVYGWKVPGGKNVHVLAGPRSEASFEGVKVSTVNDHHNDADEVAFLVQVDGLTLYHNGDYYGKATPQGPFTYREDLVHLKSKAPAVDLFFSFPVTSEPYPQLIRALEPRVLFPMHYGGREERYATFAADLAKLGIPIPVHCPRQPGDRFEYRAGKVVP